jgi:hypothetical protein
MSTTHIGSNGETEQARLAPPPGLTSSASFRARTKKTNAAGAGAGSGGVISRAGSDVDDIITLLHGSDPVRVELNRLENEVRGSHSLSLCVFVRVAIFSVRFRESFLPEIFLNAL